MGEVRLFREITKEGAVKLFTGSRSEGYVKGQIAKCDKILEGEIQNEEGLSNTIIFPWPDWGLFRAMKIIGYKSNKPLGAFSVLEAAKAFLDHGDKIHEICLSNNLKDFESINNIRESILKNGYINDSKILLVSQDGWNELYSMDGHHRFIAYQSLILQKKIDFGSIKSLFGEIKDIRDLIGQYEPSFR